MDLEAGISLGDFEILSRLGSGGMGIVYRARQVSLNRLVALKVLGPALDSEEGKARFRREAQAVARLNHPSIATVHFIGQDLQVCFMAMEFIDGVTLRKVMNHLASLRSSGRTIAAVARMLAEPGDAPGVRVERFDELTLTYVPRPSDPALPHTGTGRHNDVDSIKTSPAHIRHCCEVARDVALALEHSHQNGVVHRDIKPENLLIDRDGRVHVIDFGVARFVDDTTLTSTGALVGTPMYMSPEQVSGRLEIDHRTDVYSLGVVLYEMLTLRRPIEASTREGVLRQIVTGAPPPLSWRNHAVTRNLESVVHRAMARDLDERYPSATAFAEDLQRVLHGKRVEARPYRYRRDRSEIAAERPFGIVLLCGIILSTVMLFAPLVVFNAFDRFRKNGISSNLIETYRPDLESCAACAFAAWTSWALFAGKWWPRWVLTVLVVALSGSLSVNLLSNAEVTRLESGGYNPLFYGVVLPLLALCLLHRGSTREWLRLASRVRAEERAEATGRPVFDWAAVAAARPSGVAAACAASALISLLFACTSLSIMTGAVNPFPLADTRRPGGAFCLVSLLVSLPVLVGSILAYFGSRRGHRILLGSLAVILLASGYTTVNEFTIHQSLSHEHVSIVTGFFLLVSLSVALLTRSSAHAWFRLANRVRADAAGHSRA